KISYSSSRPSVSCAARSSGWCSASVCRSCEEQRSADMSSDGLPLRRIDHVRFFVGNARQSAYFYRNAFGFDVVAYEGLETRQRHEAGYVMRQGKITFVLISPLSGQHPESSRLIRHGDGVQDIALEVDDVRHTFAETVRRGATAVSPPAAFEDDHGVYECATIRAYGDTTHTFVNRDR